MKKLKNAPAPLDLSEISIAPSKYLDIKISIRRARAAIAGASALHDGAYSHVDVLLKMADVNLAQAAELLQPVVSQ